MFRLKYFANIKFGSLSIFNFHQHNIIITRYTKKNMVIKLVWSPAVQAGSKFTFILGVGLFVECFFRYLVQAGSKYIFWTVGPRLCGLQLK